MGAIRYRTTIGRTREVRGPDALELAIAGMIVAVVATIAAGFGGRLMLIAQTLDAISLVRAAQVNAMVYRAEQGRWPSAGAPDILGDARAGSHVEELTLEDGGVVTVQLRLGRALPVGEHGGVAGAGGLQGRLSFRPELLGSRDAPVVSFLCGYAMPIDGTVATDAVNRTTLPEKYLPPFCR
ncbi:hypothetical protein [Rhodanobacter lindaniclasticus]